MSIFTIPIFWHFHFKINWHMLSFLRKNKRYKHIFFDLDRTLWDFDRNMQLTLEELYERYKLEQQFNDFGNFLSAFNVQNERLWNEYRHGRLSKDILRWKRFELTLKEYGINNQHLAEIMGEEYVKESPMKTALVPHTREVLEHLQKNYQLHIITNGFSEVQFTKLKLCGIDNFFTRVTTSEISGYHKPHPLAFAHPLSSVNAKKSESIMVGDDLEIDIIGARKFGIDQIFLNIEGTEHNEKVTHEIASLLELKRIFPSD